MRRASDPTRSRASDWAAPPAWAPDPEQGFGRAADPDPWPARAPDPRAAWGGRAWPAPDRNQAVRPLRLGHAAGLFCAAKTAEGLSPRSIAWYGAILDRLGARFGPERPVDDLTPTELRAWLVDLRTTLAPISVAGYVRGLRAFGNWLAHDGLAEARALRTLARPRVPHKVMEPLADEDLRRLIAASDVRDRAIVLLLLDTGLRVSEAAGISLADLRPDGTIKVLGKGARERVVPVGAATRRAIARVLEGRAPSAGDAPLFTGAAGGRLTLTGIQQLLRRLRARAGVAGRCNPHTFRHTFAHRYLMNGGDVFTLQRMLGHSSLEMVRRYVALTDGDVAMRHRAASPADHLLAARPRGPAATPSTWASRPSREVRSISRGDPPARPRGGSPGGRRRGDRHIVG